MLWKAVRCGDAILRLIRWCPSKLTAFRKYRCLLFHLWLSSFGAPSKGDDKCDRALKVFSELRSQFAEDSSVMSIVRAGEEICRYNAEPLEEGVEEQETLEDESGLKNTLRAPGET